MQIQVVGVQLTNPSKASLIETLAFGFEQRLLEIIDDPVMVSELLAYEATRLPSGLMRYSAPEGVHDDCVIALALAYAVAAPDSPAEQVVTYEDSDDIGESF